MRLVERLMALGGMGIMPRISDRFRMLFGCFAYLVTFTGSRAPISYPLNLLENLELTDVFFFRKWIGILKNGCHGVLMSFMAMPIGILKLDFQKKLRKEQKRCSFTQRRKLVTGGVELWFLK